MDKCFGVFTAHSGSYAESHRAKLLQSIGNQYETGFHTKLKLKMYQIWDGFCAVAKLNGGRRSSATLTGMKQRHGVKDAQR